MPEHDDFVIYDELKGPDLDPGRWSPARLPLPTGEVHIPLDRNAEMMAELRWTRTMITSSGCSSRPAGPPCSARLRADGQPAGRGGSPAGGPREGGASVAIRAHQPGGVRAPDHVPRSGVDLAPSPARRGRARPVDPGASLVADAADAADVAGRPGIAVQMPVWWSYEGDARTLRRQLVFDATTYRFLGSNIVTTRPYRGVPAAEIFEGSAVLAQGVVDAVGQRP